MGKPRKSKTPPETRLIVQTDAESLSVTCGLEGTHPDGTPVGPNEGFTLWGSDASDLLESVDAFMLLLVEARGEIVRAARAADAASQAADGENVASNAGTTSAAPEGGETS